MISKVLAPAATGWHPARGPEDGQWRWHASRLLRTQLQTVAKWSYSSTWRGLRWKVPWFHSLKPGRWRRPCLVATHHNVAFILWVSKRTAGSDSVKTHAGLQLSLADVVHVRAIQGQKGRSVPLQMGGSKKRWMGSWRDDRGKPGCRKMFL